MPATNVAQEEKHADLIIAHGNIKIMERLLSAIDDECNDILVCVDKKTK